MHGRWEADPDAGHIREFFRLLAVCHTVIPEGPPTPTEIRYQVLVGPKTAPDAQRHTGSMQHFQMLV